MTQVAEMMMCLRSLDVREGGWNPETGIRISQEGQGNKGD
jgi:hypothetical protein